MPRQLFAEIFVSDYPLALEWYERLLGQPPSFSPNDVESVWDVNESSWIYVEHRPHHAGHALVTIFVDDIEALVASITARGIDPTRREPTRTVGTRRPTRTPTATRSGSVDSSADTPSRTRQRREPYTSAIASD